LNPEQKVQKSSKVVLSADLGMFELRGGYCVYVYTGGFINICPRQKHFNFEFELKIKQNFFFEKKLKF
jgi:hypothetical protein